MSLPGFRQLAGQGSRGWSRQPQGQGRTLPTQGRPGSGVQASRPTQRPLCGAQAASTLPGTPLSMARPLSRRPNRTSCSAPPPTLFRQPVVSGSGGGRLRSSCWERGGARPHLRLGHGKPWQSPLWWLPPPATICCLAPGPRERVGRWDSGSDRPQPLLTPPLIWAKMATPALLASVPSSVSWGL